MAPLGGILVTGTPGVGKSTLARELAKRLDMSYVEVGQIIKDEELHSGFDSERQCTIFDEDAVYEALENLFSSSKSGGGDWIVDFHSTTPMALRRWFRLIIILGCDTYVIWNRLEERGYNESKIQENLECEIMQVIEDEVREFFDEDEPEDQPEWLNGCQELLQRAELLKGGEGGGRRHSSANEIIVCKLRNNNQEELEANLQAIISWIKR